MKWPLEGCVTRDGARLICTYPYEATLLD